MNKNTTLKWIENEMKNKILIDDDILCSKSAIIGIYGIFIVSGTTEICAYVGRSANIYQRFLIGNKAHLVKLKNGVYENAAIKEAIADSAAKISVRILEKVPTFADYAQLLRQTDPSAGFGDLLLTLMQAESCTRQENQTKRRLKAAAFPYQKTLDEFDISQLNPAVSPVFQYVCCHCGTSNENSRDETLRHILRTGNQRDTFVAAAANFPTFSMI